MPTRHFTDGEILSGPRLNELSDAIDTLQSDKADAADPRFFTTAHKDDLLDGGDTELHGHPAGTISGLADAVRTIVANFARQGADVEIVPDLAAGTLTFGVTNLRGELTTLTARVDALDGGGGTAPPPPPPDGTAFDRAAFLWSGIKPSPYPVGAWIDEPKLATTIPGDTYTRNPYALPAGATTIYVGTGGVDDTAAGRGATAGSPYATPQHAHNRAAGGEWLVIVGDGTHYHWPVLNNTKFAGVVAETGKHILWDGYRQVTTWTAEGSLWYCDMTGADNLRFNPVGDTTVQMASGYQGWYDRDPLAEVMTKAEVTAGSNKFWIDTAATTRRMYVARDPAGHTMHVTWYEKGIHNTRTGFRLYGVHGVGHGCRLQQGFVRSENAKDVRYEFSSGSWTAAGGLSISAPATSDARDGFMQWCTGAWNKQSGLHEAHCHGGGMENCTMAHFNMRALFGAVTVLKGFEAAGIKSSVCRKHPVTGKRHTRKWCRVKTGVGTGLWYDQWCEDPIDAFNRISGTDVGISHEMSRGGYRFSNQVWDCDTPYYTNEAAEIRDWNNVGYARADGRCYNVLDGSAKVNRFHNEQPYAKAESFGNEYHNCVFIKTTTGGSMVRFGDNSDFEADGTTRRTKKGGWQHFALGATGSSHNAYIRNNGPTTFAALKRYTGGLTNGQADDPNNKDFNPTSLSAWRNDSDVDDTFNQMEVSSVEYTAGPSTFFVNAAAGDFTYKVSSPLLTGGTAPPAVLLEALGLPVTTTNWPQGPVNAQVEGQNGGGATLLFTDDFNRTVVDGWGPDYTPTSGATKFAVTGLVATIQSVSGSGRRITRNTVTAADVTVTILFRMSEKPTGTGATVTVEAVVRAAANNQEYRIFVRASTTDLLVGAKAVVSTETAIGTPVVAVRDYAPNTLYALKVQSSGTNPTTILRAKCWPVGVEGIAEPGWQFDQTDITGRATPASGQLGVRVAAPSATTNAPVISIDSFDAVTP